jgi:hypothetical protein
LEKGFGKENRKKQEKEKPTLAPRPKPAHLASSLSAQHGERASHQ